MNFKQLEINVESEVAPEVALEVAPLSTFFDSFDSVSELLRKSETLAAAARGQDSVAVYSTARNGVTAPVAPLCQPPLVVRSAPATDAIPFRPLLRRAMALVHIVDDGREDGETVRMRGDSLVIGRSEGEIVIPHDFSMSPRHAAIARRVDGGWQLDDLGSVTGTFVRVTTAKLKNGSVLQVGATRFRFEILAATSDPTEAWLVEIVPQGNGRRYECRGATTSIGRANGGCDIAINDPFISLAHAQLHRTTHGWRIDNSGLNGLWVRINAPVIMTNPSQFQCGEQRFVFVPLLT